MKLAFVFPGQGSQFVGMGKDLADGFAVAKDVFHEIDEALEQNLSKLMWSGDEEELKLTENAQPALMAVSLAVMAVLEKEAEFSLAERVAMVAGHSLGEYSALAAAKALSLTDTATLLKKRGQAMQKAVAVGDGAMAAILGLEFADVKEIAKIGAEAGVCQIANDNSPGQIVISGAKAAVEKAVTMASEKGAKRAVMLPVSAPFHCELMAPAADVMAEALGATEISSPVVPLVANVKADAVVDHEQIRSLLVEQVTGIVRWRESIEFMSKSGVDTICEVGAGKVLSGLNRRIDRSLRSINIANPGDLDEFVSKIAKAT